MNLPPPQPPGALPPPTPPQQPRTSRRNQVIIVIAVLGAVVVFGLASLFGDDDKSKPDGGNGGNDAFKYRWSGGVCNEDGYSGRFTNADDKDFTGKLWAVASSGGTMVARDQEAIFNLAPGDTDTVEFVWDEDSVSSCSLESVDWRY